MSEVYNWPWSRYRLASDGYERFGLTKGEGWPSVRPWRRDNRPPASKESDQP